MINDGRYPDYPLFKGLQRPLELMGITRPLHLLGGRRGWWSHCGLYRRLLSYGLCGRTGRIGNCLICGNRAYHPQTAKRAAQQKCKTWSVCVCLFAQSMTIRKTITAMCVAD